MKRSSWQNHVTSHPEIHHGDPCIKGTRIPVRTLIASLADGLPAEEILEAYPQLTHQDILGALSYAAEVLREESLIPLVVEAS